MALDYEIGIFLGISDNITKWSGSKSIDNKFVYTCIGRNPHADHGVGFIVDDKHSQAIVEIRPMHLRLIRMEIHANNTIENYMPFGASHRSMPMRKKLKTSSSRAYMIP